MRKRILKISILVCVAWFLIHIVYVCLDGISQPTNNADVALILGNKVNTNGSLSERLEQRVLCGVQLYKDGIVKHIIVSGGLGKEGYYEGDKMKEYLILNKIPDSCIILDNHGDNTLKSVKNTIALSQKMHFNSIIIVSSFYHITRTKMIFRHFGFKNVSGASPSYYEWRDFYSLFREFFAFYLWWV